MLIAIRERAKGWLAWLLVAAIVVPLAFFGVYSYVSGPSANELATVGDITITPNEVNNAYLQQRRQLEQMFGGELDPALFDELQMRREALQRLVNEAALRAYADARGFRISDDQLAAVIRSQEYFQENGQFSPELYRVLLRNNGLTPTAYEARVREAEAVSQLQGGVFASAFVTDAEVQRLVSLQNQERRLDYLMVDAAAFLDSVEVSEADVQTFYSENPGLYQTPEQVKLAYLELDQQTLMGQVEISEEDLQARYEELKDSQYRTGGERYARHILLQLPEDAPQDQVEEARARLNEYRQQITAGQASFEALAKAHSEDPGSAQAGGDLGQVSRGMMVEPFEQAVFSLNEGEISEPVRTPFGLHLVQVTRVQPEQVQSFDEVRDELRQQMAGERLENRLAELSNRLSNLAYEHPDSLEPAAQALGLEVRQTDWLSRQGAAGGLGAQPQILEAAFSDEVLREGRNSTVLELGDNRLAVVRVAEHRAAETKPLADVAGQVRETLRQQRAAAEAQELGEQLKAKAAAGESLEALAEANPAVELVQPGFVGRAAGEPPAPVLRRAFQLPKPAADAVSVDAVQLPNGNYAVLRVSEVRVPEAGPEQAPKVEALRGQLRAAQGNAAVTELVEALREEVDIQVFEERL